MNAVVQLDALLTGDRSQEEIVDEKLLFNFRRCFQWKDLSEPDSTVKVSFVDDYKQVDNLIGLIELHSQIIGRQMTCPTYYDRSLKSATYTYSDNTKPAAYCKLIAFIHFYSASHSMSLSETLPTTAIDIASEFTRRSATRLQATVSEGLVQGPYVAVRAGFEPMTIQSKGFDSSNAPPRPTNWWINTNCFVVSITFSLGSRQVLIY